MKLVRCDSCGTVEECLTGEKPHLWWERTDMETGLEYHACSRECRDKLPGIPAPY